MLSPPNICLNKISRGTVVNEASSFSNGRSHTFRSILQLYIDLKLYFENAELGGRPTSIQAFGTPDQPVIFVLGRSYLGHLTNL